MKEILGKLKNALKELEDEHGSILLFALFLREEALGKWDLLVSASWLDSRMLDSYETISKAIQKHLDVKELVQISRIVVLEVGDPAVAFLQDLHSVSNGSFVEVQNCEPLSDKFGFTIKRAYLLRCFPL
jgi:hypothetical protein